jgi:outer membrane protein assembly factor BamB
VTTAFSDKQTKPKPKGMRPGGDGGDNPFPMRPKGGFGRGDSKPPDAVYKWEVYCLNRADGKVIWKQTAAEKKPTVSATMGNSYASETPVTDGERVYAWFGNAGVFCYDLTGKQLWTKDLGTYKTAMGWGYGSSPALDGDRLFIQDDNEEKSFLVALDKKTGQELWRVDRDAKSSWSTPFVWRTPTRTDLVVCGTRKVRGYDPATGKVVWELGGQANSFSATPAADEERIYFGSSSNLQTGPLLAVKAGAKGDISLKDGETSNEGVAWSKSGAGPKTASPLLYRGHLYVLEQRGGLTCYDAKTGKSLYKSERLNGARGFTSSPWAYDGKIFCLDEDGTTFVVEAGDTFKLLGKNKIDEMCWSSVAVSGGMLFVRGLDHLYAIKK